MRESERRDIMERLRPAEEAQGRGGTNSKSAASAVRPGVGFSVRAADERAAFQLRARRAAPRSWQPRARLPGGGGARGKVTFAQSACAAARRGCEEGPAAGEPGGERKGTGCPRCLGNGNIPPGAAQRNIRFPASRTHGVSAGTLLPPPAGRQSADGAPPVRSS